MSIRRVFDDTASSYDRDRRRLIPCYDDFYSVPLEILPFQRDRELRVLDLGAGTGLLSAKVAACYQRASLVLVDISPSMLQLAEQRFVTEDRRRISFQVLDYSRESLSGTYDLVVSSLSIHHLEDVAKASLFKKICTILEPGGLFVNADQALGENHLAEKLYRRQWLQKVEASGISPAALQAAKMRMQEDRMATLSSQLAWLEEAGFADVTTWFQHYSFVVYSGTKPLPGPGQKPKNP